MAAASVNGSIRYNTNNNAFEGFSNGSWQNFATGSGVGTVQSITGGTGLTGGTINSVGTLAVNVGTGASQIPQLNGSAQLALNKGSAGAPTYSFATDALSGLLSANPGTIALATAGTSRLTIDNLGNVGIGTTSPGSTLGVVGNSSSTFPVAVQNLNSSGNSMIEFNDYQGNAQGYVGYSNSAGQLEFSAVNDDIVLYTETVLPRLTVKALGNVGIGTTSPQAALDVTATGTAASFILVPRDTTAGRPVVAASVNGAIRYNTNNNAFEGFSNGSWQNFAVGSGVGTVSSITAGTGLTGGTINSVGTLAVNVGTGSSQIPQLNGSA